eukprot:3025904-Amphidinium_carterae.2
MTKGYLLDYTRSRESSIPLVGPPPKSEPTIQTLEILKAKRHSHITYPNAGRLTTRTLSTTFRSRAQ